MKLDIFKKLNKKTNLPDSPGVYFFKKDKSILYIGKATSLKDRVKSYMSKGIFDMRGPLIKQMVKEANKISWQVTDSVLEALILEAELIKKYQPKYNTKEKSDKSFNYVCITKEKLPKVLITRGKNLNKKEFSKIYGPFTSGAQLKEALKIIRPIFPFLDDKSKNYYKFYKQVSLVPDILSQDGLKQYKKDIKNLKLFFEGKKKQVIRNLQREMKEYAELREFEKAGEIKRQIFALKHINDVALLKNERGIKSESSFIFSPLRPPHLGRDPRGFKNKRTLTFKIEAYDIAHMGGKNMVGVMTVVVDGEVKKSEYKKFKIKTQTGVNDTGALKEVLERRLAHKEWIYPSLIVVDGGMAQINVTKKIISRFHLDISVVSVVKDERHKPKAILGGEQIVVKYKREILLANNEAHRFAIAYHKKMRNKNFLP